MVSVKSPSRRPFLSLHPAPATVAAHASDRERSDQFSIAHGKKIKAARCPQLLHALEKILTSRAPEAVTKCLVRWEIKGCGFQRGGGGFLRRKMNKK